MSFSANEKFNGLFERFPRSPFGVLKQITHHFYWESNPYPQVFASVLMFFGWGCVCVPAPFNRNSEKNNSWIMLTLFENGVTEFLLDGHISTLNHHTEENNCPILQMGELVVVGYFCVGADMAVFALRNEFTGTMYGSSPLSATESPVPFLLF